MAIYKFFCHLVWPPIRCKFVRYGLVRGGDGSRSIPDGVPFQHICGWVDSSLNKIDDVQGQFPLDGHLSLEN